MQTSEWGATISTKRTLVRNTAANITAQMAQVLSAFIFMPLLISRFGLDDYGLYLLVGSLSGYLGLLDLGVGASLVKYVAEHRAKGDHRGQAETIVTAFMFYGVVGLVAAAAMILVAFFALDYFKLPAESVVLARNLLLVGAATASITWPASTGNYVLAGLQRYDLAARMTVIAVAANVLVTAVVVVTHQGPLVLLIGTSMVSIAVTLVNAAVARRELGPVRLSIASASWQRLKHIFRFSSAIFVIQLSGVLIYQQTDRLILGVFASTAAIGLYEAASKLHSLVRQLAGLTSSAVMPTASQLDAEGQHDTLVRLYLRGTKYTVILVTPVTVAIMVLAKPLLQAWLGPEFAVMAFSAQLYVSYWLLNANVTISGNMLSGTGKLKFLVWYTVIASTANVALSIILVKLIGINGVIIGTVAHAYVGFPIYMRYTSKVLGFRITDWWRQVVLPTYPFLLITLAIGMGARLGGFTNGLLPVGVTASVSVGAYWIAVYLFGLTAGERADLSKVVDVVRRKFSSTGAND